MSEKEKQILEAITKAIPRLKTKIITTQIKIVFIILPILYLVFRFFASSFKLFL